MTRTNSPARVAKADLKAPFSLPLQWCSALMLLAALLVSRPAQGQSLDDEYIAILNTIQQADALSLAGNSDSALAKYRQAQAALFEFRKVNPDWHIRVVSFRVNYLAEKLTPPPVKVAAPVENVAAEATAAPAQPKVAKTAPANGGPQLKVLAAGAEPRSILRLHPKAGDKQALDMILTIGMGVQAGDMNNPAMKLPPIKMPMDLTVKSVSPDGDIAYEMTIGEATLGEQAEAGPQQAAAELMKASLAGVKGLSGSGTLSNRGFNKGSEMKAPANADPQTRQALEQMKEMFSQTSVPLPEEAVGPGAKWEVTLPLKSQGMTLNQTATYELVSLQGDRLTAKATIVQTAANQKISNPAMPNLKVDLTKMDGRGTGDLTLDLTKPRPSAANIDSHTDMTMGMNMGGQKQSMKMQIDLNLRIESK